LQVGIAGTERNYQGLEEGRYSRTTSICAGIFFQLTMSGFFNRSVAPEVIDLIEYPAGRPATMGLYCFSSSGSSNVPSGVRLVHTALSSAARKLILTFG